MKHNELRAIVHNTADSLASGLGFLIGYYKTDVFAEAARSEDGSITIDLLEGRVTRGTASKSLSEAIVLYKDALARLVTQAGGSPSDLREATVRYWSDAIERRFSITVEDANGRRTSTEFAGVPGRRPKVIDAQGRLRPMTSIR